MSEYFVVFTNLASLPAVIYYQYHKKYYYSLQILLVSLFSFIHHIKTSGIYPIDDSRLFSLLDGWYSYLTIYAMLSIGYVIFIAIRSAILHFSALKLARSVH